MLTCGPQMGKIFKPDDIKNTRLYLMYSLVFFLWAIEPACKQHHTTISLVWQDNKAVAIIIPTGMIKDNFSTRVIIQGSNNQTSILGGFVKQGSSVNFKPLIPLSPGLAYEIWQGNRLIGSIKVPVNIGKAPELVAIYPMQDTVPENLLKFYFRFSAPMRTGEVLNHIYLLDNHQDTMRNVFLNLQPELWDKTGTVLTLWLDPGRIKRDLMLNHQLGNPLKRSQSYRLIVSHEWKDNRGLTLAKTFIKKFTAGDRDGTVPDIAKWELHIPKPGGNEPLIIKTHEPLDHYLLQESVTITDSKGKILYTNNVVSDQDKTLKLTPLPEWTAGKYSLLVKANLEDLCGNNLNRVFDRDIRKDGQLHKTFFIREFEVGK